MQSITISNFFFECNEFFLTLLFDHTCRRTRIMRAWSNPQKRYISDPLRRYIFGAFVTRGDISCEPQRKKTNQFVSRKTKAKKHQLPYYQKIEGSCTHQLYVTGNRNNLIVTSSERKINAKSYSNCRLQ